MIEISKWVNRRPESGLTIRYIDGCKTSKLTMSYQVLNIVKISLYAFLELNALKELRSYLDTIIESMEEAERERGEHDADDQDGE